MITQSEKKSVLSMSAKRRVSGAVLGVGLSVLASTPVLAGGTINFGPDQSVTVGLGLRGSLTSTSDAAPDGTSRSTDFSIDSTRLFISGSLSKTVKGTINLDRDADGQIRLLDGYAQFEFQPEFNLWAGRLLSPGDRANMSGPYYQHASSYPGLVSAYPSIFAGRDDGAVVWGKLADKKFVYAAGVFQGRNRSKAGAPGADTTSNQSGSPLYATRLAYHFWDAEPAPAYLTGSTYYGAADIFTVAVAAQHQKDGVGTKAVSDDYSAYNVDALIEKRLPAGVVTFEGAYYKYNFSAAAAAAEAKGATPGKATLLGAAFLCPNKIGVGKVQPFARFQKLDADTEGNPVTKQTDVGVNYLLDGFNARLAATYTKLTTTASDKDVDSVTLSYQFLF